MFLIMLRFFVSKFDGNIKVERINEQSFIVAEFSTKTAEKFVN